MFKMLSAIFLYLVPIGIVIAFFYQRQEFKVTFGISGIIVATVLLFKLHGRFKAWLIKKETAHEVASNQGQISKSYNVILISSAKFIFMSLPFVILLWVVYVVTHYDGRMNVPIIFILVSFFVSAVFEVMGFVKEQEKISKDNLKEIESSNENLANLIRSKL